MALPGLLAYRSIVDGGKPYAVPDLANPAVRARYWEDYYCTDPRTPAEFLLPTTKNGTPVVEEVYGAAKERFGQTVLKSGMN